MITRMIVPSSVGLTPRSESRIAFAMGRSRLGSYGLITAILASGTVTLASWINGVVAP
jgi:hypothetical protein